MARFELTGEQRASFLRYLAHQLPGQSDATSGSFRMLDSPFGGEAWMRGLGLGTHVWQEQGLSFTITYEEEGAPCGEVPAYFSRLRVAGPDADAVQQLLQRALAFRPPLPSNKIWHCAAGRYGSWRDMGLTSAQHFEDLFLPEADLKALLQHVDQFLQDAERYERLGRVHKLCLLFVGVPGSGKSSLARALALKYRRELYSLALPGLSDAVCNELVSGLASNGILLIEDFDSLGFSLASNRKRGRDEDRVCVSRSCFLNLLDGNGAPPKGTIICLTANSSTGFDQALVRAGRVDRIVTFGAPREAEILAALRRLAAEEEDREAKFATFLARLSRAKATFSMAAIVDFLFRNPSTYLENFEDLRQGHLELCKLSKDSVAHGLYA